MSRPDRDDDPAFVPAARNIFLQRYYAFLRRIGHGDIADKFIELLNAPLSKFEDR